MEAANIFSMPAVCSADESKLSRWDRTAVSIETLLLRKRMGSRDFEPTFALRARR